MDLRLGLNMLFPFVSLIFFFGICYLNITVSAVKLAPLEMKTSWIQTDHGAQL